MRPGATYLRHVDPVTFLLGQVGELLINLLLVDYDPRRHPVRSLALARMHGCAATWPDISR